MKNVLACVILFFLLPVLSAGFLNKSQTVQKNGETTDEMLSILLYQNSQEDTGTEALKAQAVVFRTVMKRYSEREWRDLLQTVVHVKQETAYAEKKELYAQVIQETADVRVEKNKTEAYLPYHQISAGWTRSGNGCTSVECAEDRKAPGFQQVFSFTDTYIQQKVFPEDKAAGVPIHIQDIQTDTAGYVQSVQTDCTTISGDQIRDLLGLSSTCFTIEKEKDRFIFTCRGIGHGYGMSLYGCQALANEGKTYLEILRYFYPDYDFL